VSGRERWLLSATVILAIALFGLLALDAWGLQLFDGSGVDYTRFGTWSDFVAGAFTTVAVVVALGAIVYDQRTRDADERRRVDAELTSMFTWVEAVETVERGTTRLLGVTWDVHVRNLTGAPIYDWVLKVGGSHRCRHTHGGLIPGDRLFNIPELDDAQPGDLPEPTLIFRDRETRVWTRSARGQLAQDNRDDLTCAHGS